MKQVRYVVIVVLVLIALIIAVQNREPVETKLLFVTVTMPRVVLLVSTTLIGFALGVIVAYVLGRAKKTTNR
jgi:uncharacterized integral membrane protein